MKVAKAKGRLRGKQPKLNPRQEAHLVSLLHSGEYSTAELGDLFGVARSTVYRAVPPNRPAPRRASPPEPAVAAVPYTAPAVPQATRLRDTPVLPAMKAD